MTEKEKLRESLRLLTKLGACSVGNWSRHKTRREAWDKASPSERRDAIGLLGASGMIVICSDKSCHSCTRARRNLRRWGIRLNRQAMPTLAELRRSVRELTKGTP